MSANARAFIGSATCVGATTKPFSSCSSGVSCTSLNQTLLTEAVAEAEAVQS